MPANPVRPHQYANPSRRHFLCALGATWLASPLLTKAALAIPPDIVPISWITAWPHTDFLNRTLNLRSFLFSGEPRDGTEIIDRPALASLGEIAYRTPSTDPVISIRLFGHARAYPLRYLVWHEVINDELGGVPILITYCPRTDTALIHDRRVAGEELLFGKTGMLRDANLILYDRGTESWWHQYGGGCEVGHMAGAKLKLLPARVESIATFAKRYGSDSRSKVMVAGAGERSYGLTPYSGYDGRPWPFVRIGSYAEDIPALERVIAVEGHGWPLSTLRARERVKWLDFSIRWEAGRSSVLDTPAIEEGRDLGNVTVQRHPVSGRVHDIPYRQSFAFAFRAFQPEGILHRE